MSSLVTRPESLVEIRGRATELLLFRADRIVTFVSRVFPRTGLQGVQYH